MRMRTTYGVAFVVAFAFLAVACAPAPKAAKDLNFVYICKKLSDEWFAAEDRGAKARALSLGVKYSGIDVDYNNEKAIQAIETVIAEGVDGVLITVPDQGLGPAVAKRLREANIPVITIDDFAKDGAGKLLPYIGVPTYQAGLETGTVIAQAALDRGFFAAGNKVKVMVATMAHVPTMVDTAQGYTDGILKLFPQVKPEDVLLVDTKDGSFDSSITALSAAYNANPGVTHWVIAAVDDYPAQAAVKMLKESNFDFKKCVIAGTGAYSVSEDLWKAGGDVANSYFARVFFPKLEGETGIQVLFDFVTKGTPIPDMTIPSMEGFPIVADITNWEKIVGRNN